MGTVLRFPAERVRGALYAAARGEPAAILILPVVQIKRDEVSDEGPGTSGFEAATSSAGSGRRRRRAPRS